jgi:hypothetical protein
MIEERAIFLISYPKVAIIFKNFFLLLAFVLLWRPCFHGYGVDLRHELCQAVVDQSMPLQQG